MTTITEVLIHQAVDTEQVMLLCDGLLDLKL